MGYDITYHPIKESEIQEWYFDALQNEQCISKEVQKINMDEFYAEKYREVISIGKNAEIDREFDFTHGYYIAVVQGFFREHFYLRGSAFSFLIKEHPMFKKYTKKWEDIINFEIKQPINNCIVTNYSSGVFIPAKQVKQLLNDFDTNEEIRSVLENFYSGEHIAVFITALERAEEINGGLLEATEVVEPNPLDINESVSYSNLYNCNIKGVFLYQNSVIEQLKQTEQEQGLEENSIIKNTVYKRINSEEE